MSQWHAAKAKKVLATLQGIGWTIKRQSGSYRTLTKQGHADSVFAFHDSAEIGPKMLSRIAKHTGLNTASKSRLGVSLEEINGRSSAV